MECTRDAALAILGKGAEAQSLVASRRCYPRADCRIASGRRTRLVEQGESSVDYVRLGKTSLRVSRIALGAMGIGDRAWRSWVLPEDEAQPIVAHALDLGVNLFDTCDYYSAGESERVLGRLLKTVPRDQVVIATKVGMPMSKHANARGYSRKHIIEACEASLRRLDTDYIDLYQTHIWDPTTDIDEMIAAFDHLVRAGKVLYLGATDMPCWQFAKSVYTARSRGLHQFASMQHHYNLLWREDERELIPFCHAEGIGQLPYSPMARGFLCGAVRRQQRSTERARTDEYAHQWFGRPEDAQLAEVVDEVARRRGVASGQLALAWVLNRQPQATAIIGATKAEHVDQAVAALQMSLDPSEIERMESAYALRPKAGH